VAVEDRLERGQLLERGIRSDVVVLRHSAAAVVGHVDRRNLRGQPAVRPRSGGFTVRPQGPAILVFAFDGVFLGHQLGGLAHRQAGRGFGNSRRHRRQIGQTQTAQAAQFAAHGFGLTGADHGARERRAQADRHVREHLGAAGDDHVGIAAFDQVGGVGDGLAGRGAGQRDGIGRRVSGQAGGQDQLSREIGVGDGSGDVAIDQVVDAGGVEREAGDELSGDGAGEIEHVEASEIGAGTQEGGAQAGDEGSASHGRATPQNRTNVW
jgi:hypothetical protein